MRRSSERQRDVDRDRVNAQTDTDSLSGQEPVSDAADSSSLHSPPLPQPQLQSATVAAQIQQTGRTVPDDKLLALFNLLSASIYCLRQEHRHPTQLAGMRLGTRLALELGEADQQRLTELAPQASGYVMLLMEALFPRLFLAVHGRS